MHEHFLAADVFLDLDLHFAVGEAPDLRLAQADAQFLAHGLGQRPVGVAGEHQQFAIFLHWKPASGNGESGIVRVSYSGDPGAVTPDASAGLRFPDSGRFRLGRGGRIRTCGCRDQNPVPWATWRRPCMIICSCAGRAPRLQRDMQRRSRCALQPSRPAFRQAARASAACARARSPNSTKQPLPVPVSRGTPIRASAANAASTAGSRRRSTGSNALPEHGARNEVATLSRAAHPASIQGLGTVRRSARARRGSTRTYHAGGKSIGVSRFADAFGPGIVATDEDRDVGAQLQGQARPSASAPRSSAPQRRRERPATVAASEEPPPKPPPARNRLFDDDVRTLARHSPIDCSNWRRVPRDHRPPPHRRPSRRARMMRPSSADPQADPVAPVQQSEHGLQRVVAVRAAAGDPQEQIEFGRRRPAATSHPLRARLMVSPRRPARRRSPGAPWHRPGWR